MDVNKNEGNRDERNEAEERVKKKKMDGREKKNSDGEVDERKKRAKMG